MDLATPRILLFSLLLVLFLSRSISFIWYETL